MSRKNKFLRLAATTIALLLLSNCGGGDSTSISTNYDTNVGQLIDSPVEHIGYRTETQSGYTDSNGEFKYMDGESVTFFIGSIEFPTLMAKPIISPLDLADTDDILNPTAINLMRLLQSLDEDGTPDNGITIPAAAEAASVSPARFDISEEEFESLPGIISLVAGSGSTNTTLIDSDDAVSHCARQLGIDFKAGPFTAEYYNGLTFIASETVGQPSIKYSWSDFNHIDSYDFNAIWSGELEVQNEAKIIDINFGLSWSDVSLYIDGIEISRWSNSPRTIQHEFAVGVHDIVIEYHNNWHTTNFNVTFTDSPIYTKDEAISKFAALIDSNTQVIYVGAYESANLYNQTAVTLEDTADRVFLFLSSYNAINWVINNPNNVKIAGVAFDAYNSRPSVAVGRSSPIFALDNFAYGYSNFTAPKADIQYMTGRAPDYTYGQYGLGQATISIP